MLRGEVRSKQEGAAPSCRAMVGSRITVMTQEKNSSVIVDQPLEPKMLLGLSQNRETPATARNVSTTKPRTSLGVCVQAGQVLTPSPWKAIGNRFGLTRRMTGSRYFSYLPDFRWFHSLSLSKQWKIIMKNVAISLGKQILTSV